MGYFMTKMFIFSNRKKKDHLKKYSNQDIIFLLHKILSNLNCVVLAKDLGDQPIPIFYRSEYSKRNFLVVSQSTFSNGAPVKTICLVHVDHRYSASYSESLLSASINFFCDYRCHSVKLRACRRSVQCKLRILS